MSTSQHSSERHNASDKFTLEFTRIPNCILDCVIGADQGIQLLATGRVEGNHLGFCLERYSIEDDKQKGCFTLVISGHATDVLHAQTWIFHRIRDSLLADVCMGCFVRKICSRQLSELQQWPAARALDNGVFPPCGRVGRCGEVIESNVSWELRGESGRFHLCIPDNWQEHFFPQPAPPPPQVLPYVASPQAQSNPLSEWHGHGNGPGRYGPGNWSGVLSDAVRFNNFLTTELSNPLGL